MIPQKPLAAIKWTLDHSAGIKSCLCKALRLVFVLPILQVKAALVGFDSDSMACLVDTPFCKPRTISPLKELRLDEDASQIAVPGKVPEVAKAHGLIIIDTLRQPRELKNASKAERVIKLINWGWLRNAWEKFGYFWSGSAM